MTLEEARSLFPVLSRVAYLNAGTFGPLSTGTMAAIRAEQQRDLDLGRWGKAYVDRMVEHRTALLAALARLVGVELANLTLAASTTDGCNIVVAGLGLGQGDEVITTTDEHFGLLGPLHASGARVVVVEPDEEAILAAVTPRTRLLALSHVLWTTGQVLPVRELRERVGVPILVDGAQSVGAIPVSAAGLDFMTISGQKWLCGPDSIGALYVADPERLGVARPSFFAQASHTPDGAYEPRPGAERFQPNWVPISSLAGLLSALGDVPAWSYEHARAQAEALRAQLDGLVELVVPDQRATLVSFRPPAGQTGTEVVERLAQAGVVVRELPGRNLVRASVGWWTSDDDLRQLVDALAA